jgi:hypothetical protein
MEAGRYFGTLPVSVLAKFGAYEANIHESIYLVIYSDTWCLDCIPLMS